MTEGRGTWDTAFWVAISTETEVARLKQLHPRVPRSLLSLFSLASDSPWTERAQFKPESEGQWGPLLASRG